MYQSSEPVISRGVPHEPEFAANLASAFFFPITSQKDLWRQFSAVSLNCRDEQLSEIITICRSGDQVSATTSSSDLSDQTHQVK